MKIYMVNGLLPRQRGLGRTQSLKGGGDWYPFPLLGNRELEEMASRCNLNLGLGQMVKIKPVPMTTRGLGYTTPEGRKGGLDVWTPSTMTIKPYTFPAFTPFTRIDAMSKKALSMPLFTATTEILKKGIESITLTTSEMKAIALTLPSFPTPNEVKTLQSKINSLNTTITSFNNYYWDFSWDQIWYSSGKKTHKDKNIVTAINKAMTTLDSYKSLNKFDAWDVTTPWNTAKKIRDNANKVLNFVNGASVLASKGVSNGVDWMAKLMSSSNDVIGSVLDVAEAIPPAISSWAMSVASGVKDTAQDIVEKYGSKLKTILEDFLTELTEAIQYDVAVIINTIQTYIKDWSGAIQYDMEDLSDYLASVSRGMYDNFVYNVNQMVSYISNNVRGMSSAVKSEIDYYMNYVQTQANQMITQLKVEVQQNFIAMQNQVNATIQQFKGDVASALKQVEDNGRVLYKGVKDELDNAVRQLQKVQQDVQLQVDRFDQMKRETIEWIGSAEERFKDIEQKLALPIKTEKIPFLEEEKEEKKTPSWWPFSGMGAGEYNDMVRKISAIQLSGHGDELACSLTQHKSLDKLKDKDLLGNAFL